jgi:hypothetical protein
MPFMQSAASISRAEVGVVTAMLSLSKHLYRFIVGTRILCHMLDMTFVISNDNGPTISNDPTRDASVPGWMIRQAKQDGLFSPSPPITRQPGSLQLSIS